MKKILYFVAMTTLVIGTTVSCGKSTKGKMDADWTIDTYTETSTTTSGGSTNEETATISGTVIKIETNNGSSVKKGTVNQATWAISKDGTYEKITSFTFIDTNLLNQVVTTNVTTTITGNWDFLTGVGEFAKNERVVFYTLNNKQVTSTTVNSGTPTVQTISDTYLDGEVSEIYKITESKKKSLSLTFSGSNSTTTTQGSSSAMSKATDEKSYTLSSN